MPTRDQAAHPLLAAAVRDAFEGIPHVRVASVGWEGVVGMRDAPPRPETHHLAVRVDGWSPGLHGACLAIDLDLAEALHDMPAHQRPIDPAAPVPDDVSALVPIALGILAAHVARQRLRARHAADLGIAVPLPAPTRVEVETGRPVAIGHLLVDRSAAATLVASIADGGPAPRLILGRAVADAHRGGVFHDGVVHNPGGPVSRAVVVDADAGPVAEIALDLPGTRIGRIVGNTLIVGARLPDTAMAAAPGRPLRDIVDLGPAFAGRTVGRVHRTVGPTSIVLEPDLVRVDEAFPEIARTAPAEDPA